MELNDGKVKVLAYYLPQFHPTKENDEWWGAWLSPYKDKSITIHPKWFIRDIVTKDFYPEDWIEA